MPLKRINTLKKFLPWLILLAGLVTTYFLKKASEQRMTEELTAKFRLQATELTNALEKRLGSHMLILRGAAAAARHATHAHTRHEFAAFVQALNFPSHFQGALGVGYIQRVHRKDMAAHINENHRLNGRQYKIWPPSQQDFYAPILYIEPATPRAKSMTGFDMYAIAERRTAMDIARDLGRPSISGKIELMREEQENRQAGFLMFHPVYSTTVNPATIQQRRERIIGWVYSAFRLNDLLKSIQRDFDYALNVQLLPVANWLPANAVTATNRNTSPPAEMLAAFDFKRQLNFSGQSWLMQVSAPPSYKMHLDTRETEIIQLSGIIISFLLFAYFLNLSRSRERAESHAHAMTKDLRESEYRWQFAIEGAGDALLDWDITSDTTFYSQQWQSLIGISPQGMGTSLLAWQDRIHPDDRDALLSVKNGFIRGNHSIMTVEYRLRREDGSYVWVRGRAAVVTRAQNGAPLRIIATSADITTEKNNRAALERVTRFRNALSNTNHAIIYCQSEAPLLNELGLIAVNDAGMTASLIFSINHADQTLLPISLHGQPLVYPEALQTPLAIDQPGYDAVSDAIQTRQAVWVQNLELDTLPHHWLTHMLPDEAQSMAVLPIFRERELIGLWLIASVESHAFYPEVQALLLEIVSNVNHAITHIFLEEQRILSEQSLRESEARYNALFAKSALAKLVIDPDTGKITDANQQATLLYGWDRERLCSMHIREINTLPPSRITPAMLQALRNEKNQFYFQHRRADGSLIDVEVFSGSVDVNGKKMILSTIHDVTESQKTKVALEQSEAMNSTILNSLGEHIALLNENGTIITVNRAWLQFAAANGGTSELSEWVGVNYLDACVTATAQVATEAQAVSNGIRSVLSGKEATFEMEYTCDSDKEHRWFHMRVSRLLAPHTGVVISHKNITDRKLHEVEIINSRSRLSILTSQLIHAQESERKSLARELHDEMGQRFTSLNLTLHQLLPHLAVPQAHDIFEQISHEVAGLIDQMRSMSGSLRPPALDYFGLEVSLKNLLKQHFGGQEIHYELEYAGLPKKLPEQLEITVYRIIQEAINNISRHAHATRAVIEVNGGENAQDVEIIIRDNGIGFDTTDIRPSAHNNSGFGLIGMLERAKLLGGNVRISSVPGAGTRIQVSLPLT